MSSSLCTPSGSSRYDEFRRTDKPLFGPVAGDRAVCAEQDLEIGALHLFRSLIHDLRDVAPVLLRKTIVPDHVSQPGRLDHAAACAGHVHVGGICPRWPLPGACDHVLRRLRYQRADLVVFSVEAQDRSLDVDMTVAGQPSQNETQVPVAEVSKATLMIDQANLIALAEISGGDLSASCEHLVIRSQLQRVALFGRQPENGLDPALPDL